MTRARSGVAILKLAMVFSATASLGVSGCDSKRPSASAAQSAIELGCIRDTTGAGDIVRFRMFDGTPFEQAGVAMYRAKIDLEIELNRPTNYFVFYGEGSDSAYVEIKDGDIAFDPFRRAGDPPPPKKPKGKRIVTTGEVVFVKTDDGWRVVDARFHLP